MGVNVEAMRTALQFESNKYKGKRWAAKVAKWSPSQVIAVYYNFEREGLFNNSPTKEQKKEDSQISMFDVFGDVMRSAHVKTNSSKHSS